LERTSVDGTYCGELDNAEDHIGRTLAYYQSQNKLCKKVIQVHISKTFKFHSIWIEEISYYSLLGVYYYYKDITEIDKTVGHEGHKRKL
jgi:hypothetical protein